MFANLLNRPSRTRTDKDKKASKEAAARLPYTPVFQPPGYRYKIALPHAPKPGETPFPRTLPSVLQTPPEAPRPTLQRSHTLPAPRPAPARDEASTARRASVRAGSDRARSKALPPLPDERPLLNPLLDPARRALSFCIAAPPAFIKLHGRVPQPLTHAHRAQPLAHPPPPRAVLRTSLGPASWTVEVRGGTVGAALDAVYETFQAPLAQAEWAALPPAMQARVAAAYRARARDPWERGAGIRRVDVLLERTVFAGLAPTADPGVFDLLLAAA